MIRVTVELIPHGVEARKRTLAVGEIANDGSGTYSSGNYTAWFGRVKTGKARNGRQGEVKDFPRQAKNVWHLLAHCLRAAKYR